MDKNVLISLVANAQKYLPNEEFVTFRKQVNEVYLQTQLDSLYQGMPLDRKPEPWRADQIATITQQLATL